MGFSHSPLAATGCGGPAHLSGQTGNPPSRGLSVELPLPVLVRPRAASAHPLQPGLAFVAFLG